MPQTTKLQSGVAIKQQTAGDLENIIPDRSINLDKLTIAAIQALITPTGVISSFGGTTAPDGWLLCDGSTLLRTDYPELFAVIGTAFGAPSPTEFNVPDLRGRFLRGVDGGQGRDPDAAGRTEMNTGGNTGNNVGSVQQDALQNITGSFLVSSRSRISSGAFSNGAAGGESYEHHNFYGQGYYNFNAANVARTSTETRPSNAYVNFIIKY